MLLVLLLGVRIAPANEASKAHKGAPGKAATVPTSSVAAPYHVCRAKLKEIIASPAPAEPDWSVMNKKPETLALIEEYGGLTANMKVFMKLYESHGWGRGSGEGSSVAYAAKTICVLSGSLHSLFNVNVLIDVPCGDQQWAPTLREMTPGLKYIGVDVMPGLVQANRERFGHANGRVEFFLGDMGVQDGLFASIRKRSTLWGPNDEVAVMSRHVLQHMDYPGIFHYIDELKKSGVRYFIGTNNSPWVATANPKSLSAGGYAQLNFYVAPFRWPQGALKWFEADYGTMEMEIWMVDWLPTGAQMKENLDKMQ